MYKKCHKIHRLKSVLQACYLNGLSLWTRHFHQKQIDFMVYWIQVKYIYCKNLIFHSYNFLLYNVYDLSIFVIPIHYGFTIKTNIYNTRLRDHHHQTSHTRLTKIDKFWWKWNIVFGNKNLHGCETLVAGIFKYGLE